MAEVGPLDGQPRERLHPRPVTDLITVALAPTHLRDGLAPGDDVPPVRVVDVYGPAADVEQALRGWQVLCPQGLQEAPLRRHAGVPPQLLSVMQAERQEGVQECSIAASKRKPRELGELVVAARGAIGVAACEVVHVCDGGQVRVLLRLITPLGLLGLLFPVFGLHLRGVVREDVHARPVHLAVLDTPATVNPHSWLALNGHLDSEGHHLLTRAVAVVVHDHSVLSGRHLVPCPHDVLHGRVGVWCRGVHVHIELSAAARLLVAETNLFAARANDVEVEVIGTIPY
mmetsp:Transcript_5878/g.17511  ORF Transcript_5878/g.17511 Transcript_5878/m.17511 type:complete len:286 (+) Transcript_5878:951-1808(+)